MQEEMSSIVTAMSRGAEAVQAGNKVIESVGEGMGEINHHVGKVKDGMGEIATVLSGQGKASEEVAVGVASVADMLLGRCSLRDNELADHHSCRLGKWYYSELAADYRIHRAFRRLEEPHVRVHRHGKEAARLYNAGNLEGALAAIAEVEKASEDVLRLLGELQEASR